MTWLLLFRNLSQLFFLSFPNLKQQSFKSLLTLLLSVSMYPNFSEVL